MSERYYNELRAALAPLYAEGEARAIAFLVLEEAFGIGRMDVYARKDIHFSGEEAHRWQNILHRLQTGEPVQYVLGQTLFRGRPFRVTPATLIPRPETEELVAWACETPAGSILDVGTGSGCIAISLALDIAGTRVEGWDISDEALAVARENAAHLRAEVAFSHRDVLTDTETGANYDLIISNPPYVCQSEAADMERHVLDHEPATALFVPDSDPQRFYRALADLSLRRLRPGGRLLVETNRAHAAETARLFAEAGLCDVELRHDAFGNPRMVGARLPW